MIANIGIVLGAALVTYATRVAGFAIAARTAGRARETTRCVRSTAFWSGRRSPPSPRSSCRT